MAFAFQCPKCEAVLRTAKAVTVGKKVDCPKCDESFVMEEDFILDEAEAAAKKAPAKAMAGAAQRTKKRADEEEEEEDDDDAPKKKQPPKETPKSLFDPKVNKKRKRKKKKSERMLLIGLGAAALVMMGGFAFMVYFLMFRTSLDAAMLAYAPANAERIYTVDFEDLRSSDKATKSAENMIREEFGKDAEALKSAGVAEAQLARWVKLATKSGGTMSGFRLNKPCDFEKVGAAWGGTKTTHNGKTAFSYKQGGESMLLVSPEPDLIVAVSDSLARNVPEKNPKITLAEQPLKMLKEGWNSSAYVAAVGPSAFPAVTGTTATTELLGIKFPSCKSIGVIFRINGETCDFRLVMQTNSKESAKSWVDGKPLTEDGKIKIKHAGAVISEVAPGFMTWSTEALESAEASYSGEMAYISCRVDTVKSLQFIASAKGSKVAVAGNAGSGGPKGGGPNIIPSGAAGGGIVLTGSP